MYFDFSGGTGDGCQGVGERLTVVKNIGGLEKIREVYIYTRVLLSIGKQQLRMKKYFTAQYSIDDKTSTEKKE